MSAFCRLYQAHRDALQPARRHKYVGRPDVANMRCDKRNERRRRLLAASISSISARAQPRLKHFFLSMKKKNITIICFCVGRKLSFENKGNINMIFIFHGRSLASIVCDYNWWLGPFRGEYYVNRCNNGNIFKLAYAM